MDLQTAQHLNELNARFYDRVHESFSATRQTPWPGWMRVYDALREARPSHTAHELRVLDLACGNLRFERYLASREPHVHAWCVDRCASLAKPHAQDLPSITLQNLDIVATLLQGNDLARAIDAPLCDLSACFGFMHHVAMPEHRLRVLEALAQHTQPGGVIAVSFWQFSRSPRIMAKAKPLPSKGDYLLGWQNDPNAQRYCHNFDEEEVDALAASLQGVAHELCRYSADGKTGNLNRYLLLQVR